MTSPSKPLSIKHVRRPPGEATESVAASIVNSFVTGTGTGTPDLRSRRAYYAGTPPPNIPPRSMPLRTGSPAISFPPSGAHTPQRAGPSTLGGISAGRPGGTQTPSIDVEELPEEEKIKVLRRHLALHEDRPPLGETSSAKGSDAEGLLLDPDSQSRTPTTGEPFPIPYHAPGADVTHDIYKWHADQTRQTARARATSFAGLSTPPHPAFEHIHEPGGFRRNYVLLRSNGQGEEPRILNNFIDFLYLFGHFAGEDLEEEDDDDETKVGEDEEEAIPGPATRASERTPLLQTQSGFARRRRRDSISRRGNATVTQAVLMLLKSFVGTGVLLLGRAFFNGGILFSALTFVFISCVSLYSFLLLVETKNVVHGSFGDIGGTLFGSWLRYVILASIVLSQMGFVSAYTIFVAQSLQAFVEGVTNCLKTISMEYLILAQLIIILPFALVRDIAKLSSTALVADIFIVIGLVYIFGSEIGIILERGVAKVEMFNPNSFSLFIGTAVFAFEGIGLVIPISDAMREPQKFPAVITGVMVFLLILLGGAGALGYLTFGKDIEAVVLVNLDRTSKMVQGVQFVYSLAILLSVPLQLFPAIRIMENGLFTRSGKGDSRVKWLKNVFRFGMVMACTFVSFVGAGDLDKFVALIGCLACVPLTYIYPAMLHYRACANTPAKKIADITMFIFGIVACVFTTTQTIGLILAPVPTQPKYCEST